jgi:hypothetical protein
MGETTGQLSLKWPSGVRLGATRRDAETADRLNLGRAISVP